MKDIKFNWCVPREYKDDNGEIRHAICRGNEKMSIGTLLDMQNETNEDMPKDALPWGQAFANGYRVMSNSLDFGDWNGTTFSDIDSKWFYRYCKPFNVDKLLKAIVEWAPILFENNYYACHLTNSKQGYRIFWYWDCEKTEENFRKCCILTEKYTRELFYNLGEQAKEIIDYKVDGHRVLDKCSNSIMQGFYITPNKIYFTDKSNSNEYGNVVIDDITLEQAYQSSILVKTVGNFEQSKFVKTIEVNEPNSDEIRYYPHQHRRCIYEALVVLYKEKPMVDEQWDRVSKLLPEGNGHDYMFYLNEPDKCKWFERTNNNILHDLSWIKPFGYEYVDEVEYVYWRQFRKSWKQHIRKMVMNEYLGVMKKAYDNENGKGSFAKLKTDEQETFIAGWKQHIDESDIFSKKWDIHFDEDGLSKLNELRSQYWKTRWESKDFKYLCSGYDIPKDIVTYKFYADFYYRDNNNVPNIKYDVLEDQVNVIGYWPETDKIQWHVFKYNDEYTHWKNDETFSNKAVKTDMLCAINKYVPRWHSYHTLKDYLNSLDLSTANEELLETWAIRYFKADDTKLTRTICKNFFIAAVKKQMVEKPADFVFQHMLLLQGPTGCGKTYFLVQMFTIDGHSYILNKIDPNGKDNEIGPLIAKNWLIQFGESENLKKVSVNAAKEFMDRINLGMKYQKKYENEQTTVYPRIVACRTSNDDILFNDVSVDVDRRNWLIECKTERNACDENMRNLIKSEKDILWATAYKMYLDDPDMDLELPVELFDELANLQESHKLITDNDIKEVYDDIFERDYVTDAKSQIMDETSFIEQLKHSDDILDRGLMTTTSSDMTMLGIMEDQKGAYMYRMRINRIPASWLKNYIVNKYGINTYTLLRQYMLKNGWECKTAGWHDTTKKCFVR